MDTIRWKLPPKRRGVAGKLDSFIGPGATKAELRIQFGGAIIAAAGAGFYAAVMRPDWGPLYLIVVGLLALDLMGGVITNATSAAKRWYHRAELGLRAHLTFAAVHLLHIVLVAWLFMNGSFVFFFQASGLLVISILLVQFSPLYMQRPIAFSCYSVALLFFIYGPSAVVGLEWFVPFFYLKVVMSHAVREEPYRPNWEDLAI
ncbi:hypothetical protein [Spirochaeta dissipatitropha]